MVIIESVVKYVRLSANFFIRILEIVSNIISVNLQQKLSIMVPFLFENLVGRVMSLKTFHHLF